MCDFSPYENGVAVYQSEETLIIWNKSATFNEYQKLKHDSKCCFWLGVEAFTNFRVKTYEEAEEYAQHWVSVKGSDY
jgi:hypothetical protein